MSAILLDDSYVDVSHVSKAAWDTRSYAWHLRGRATVRDGMWQIRVVNLDTGEVVVYDDGRIGLDRAFAEAEFATAAARAAWIRGLTKKQLLRKGQKS